MHSPAPKAPVHAATNRFASEACWSRTIQHSSHARWVAEATQPRPTDPSPVSPRHTARPIPPIERKTGSYGLPPDNTANRLKRAAGH